MSVLQVSGVGNVLKIIVRNPLSLSSVQCIVFLLALCQNYHTVWHQCKKITVSLPHPPFSQSVLIPSESILPGSFHVFILILLFVFLADIKVCMIAHMERCLQQVHTCTHMHTQAGGEEPHHEQGAR